MSEHRLRRCEAVDISALGDEPRALARLALNGAAGIPPLFAEHLAHAILRGILDGCGDVGGESLGAYGVSDAFDTVDPVKLGPVSHGEPLLDIQKKA